MAGTQPVVSAVPPWWRRALRPVVLGVFAYLIISLARKVDWGEVWSSLGHLAVWQLLALAGMLVLRRFLDAWPLTFYIPDLSPPRALQNDVSAALISIAAPPPSDMVLRVSMFKSWGIDVNRGLAGAVMNMVSFYVARFSVPLVGLVILIGFHGVEPAEVATACTSLLVVAGIVIALVLILQAEEMAARVGRFFGSLVRRLRSSVDPEAWARACVKFRANSAQKARRGVPRAVPVLIVMIVIDGTILLLALRFMEVPAAAVPVALLIGTYLLSYPLTLFPFSGIGVFDAVLIALMVEAAGEAYEPEILAAVLIWRAFTIGGPLVMGGIALTLWRRAGNTWDRAAALEQ